MNERLKLSLRGLWLIVSFSAIIIPVFLPSGRSSDLIGNPIELALASMFVLSLPSSLVALPVAAFIDALIGLGSTPIGSQYLFILLLFVVGAVQWFWLVPRVFRRESMIQPIELTDRTLNVGLPEVRVSEFDLDGATRLERVLVQSDRG